MNPFRSRRGLVAGFAAVALLAGGIVYAVTAQAAVPANATDVVKIVPCCNTMPSPDIQKTVLSVAVPAGKWVVTATAHVGSNDLRKTNVACDVHRGSTSLASGGITLGDTAGAVRNARVSTDSGVVALTGTTTLTVKCLYVGPVALEDPVQVGRVTLWAHKAAVLGT